MYEIFDKLLIINGSYFFKLLDGNIKLKTR